MAKQASPMRPKPIAHVRPGPFEQWQKNQKRRGMDWAKVSSELLHLATAAITLDGATIVFSPAMGGLGVCVRVWDGDNKWTEYAHESDDLNILLEAVFSHYESSSEDLRQSLGYGSASPEVDAQEG
jgi:hypothetical protein